MSDLLKVVQGLEILLQNREQALGGRLFIDALPDELRSAGRKAAEIKTVLQAAQNRTLANEPATGGMQTMAQDKVHPQWQESTSLPQLRERIHTCLRCKLGPTRGNFVFGVGNPQADIMLIGEAPGAEEDAQGEPFVGRAGQLLNKILAAIQLSREEVYIANIIKCRPPDNRRPEKDEIEQCEPYLFRQIDLIKPKFILSLGATSVNALLKGEYKMGDIRGQQIAYRGATLIATYHPAALLRNPHWKRKAWEDVQLLRRLYDESRAESDNATTGNAQ